MSTIEDFKNAPLGATATRADGSRAMKIDDGEQHWITLSGNKHIDAGMVFCDYTLDAPAPTSASEALNLTWELAHKVKPEQVIPKGARYLENQSSGLVEYTTPSDFKIRPERAPYVRTLEPLPEPEPDWIDAPAVIARVHNWHSCADPQVFTRYDFEGEPSKWICNEEKTEFNWIDLVDVTPLYPKGH